MKQKLILITGAAGFIGSGVVRHLNESGFYSIAIVDDLGKTDKWKNLVGKQFAHLISREQLFEWLQGRHKEIQAIIHLGACSNTLERDADYLLNNNFRFSVRLAEYALNNQIPFLYASSAATYGDGSLGFKDDHEQLEQLYPLNMYGYSKQLFDLWAKDQGVLNRLVGLKYFNIFGPNEAHKNAMASAITRMVPNVQKEGVIRLFRSSDPAAFADGEQKRDFLYVKDAVRMTCAFLDKPKGGIYNIGSGVASSWNALAHAVFKALNRPPRIEYISMPAEMMGKYQNYTCADMNKTQTHLGQIAQSLPLEEAVKDYIQGHLLAEKTW